MRLAAALVVTLAASLCVAQETYTVSKPLDYQVGDSFEIVSKLSEKTIAESSGEVFFEEGRQSDWELSAQVAKLTAVSAVQQLLVVIEEASATGYTTMQGRTDRTSRSVRDIRFAASDETGQLRVDTANVTSNSVSRLQMEAYSTVDRYLARNLVLPGITPATRKCIQVGAVRIGSSWSPNVDTIDVYLQQSNVPEDATVTELEFALKQEANGIAYVKGTGTVKRPGRTSGTLEMMVEIELSSGLWRKVSTVTRLETTARNRGKVVREMSLVTTVSRSRKGPNAAAIAGGKYKLGWPQPQPVAGQITSKELGVRLTPPPGMKKRGEFQEGNMNLYGPSRTVLSARRDKLQHGLGLGKATGYAVTEYKNAGMNVSTSTITLAQGYPGLLATMTSAEKGNEYALFFYARDAMYRVHIADPRRHYTSKQIKEAYQSIRVLEKSELD